MLPGTATDTLLAKQKEFTDRVATLKHSADLAEFIEDVGLWLHSPDVCNRVSPQKVDGAWRLILSEAPFVMTDGEKISLAYGIRAFTFRANNYLPWWPFQRNQAQVPGQPRLPVQHGLAVHRVTDHNSS